MQILHRAVAGRSAARRYQLQAFCARPSAPSHSRAPLGGQGHRSSWLDRRGATACRTKGSPEAGSQSCARDQAVRALHPSLMRRSADVPNRATTPTGLPGGPPEQLAAPYSAKALAKLATPVRAFPHVDAPGSTLDSLFASSASECAKACIAKAACTAASWRGVDLYREATSPTCVLKALSAKGEPCTPPSSAVPAHNAYLLLPQASSCALLPPQLVSARF